MWFILLVLLNSLVYNTCVRCFIVSMKKYKIGDDLLIKKETVANFVTAPSANIHHTNQWKWPNRLKAICYFQHKNMQNTIQFWLSMNLSHVLFKIAIERRLWKNVSLKNVIFCLFLYINSNESDILEYFRHFLCIPSERQQFFT